jgi:FkbM family methyltransferase
MKLLMIGLCLLLQVTCFATYYSQCGQDEFIHQNYFKGYTSGIFIEIGANNGITYSNTCFFEKELNWTGICVEPIPEIFTELEKNRECTCIQGCITNRSGQGQLLVISNSEEAKPDDHLDMLSGLIDKYDPRHIERIKREVESTAGSYKIIDVNCYVLNELLEQNGITHINLLSIDTEGGEFDILSTIDFSRYQIDVLLIEDNYGDPRFISFLAEKGFNFVRQISGDLIFVRQGFK